MFSQSFEGIINFVSKTYSQATKDINILKQFSKIDMEVLEDQSCIQTINGWCLNLRFATLLLCPCEGHGTGGDVCT
jgi:hypothetical protein